ncbi:MAG: hypothetical protein K6G58_06170 [Lachnospiraceae bacterium]|nr:hypothetical protein [Lachnospiraceae bacterium]
MKNILRADIGRILGKKILWILIAAACGIYIGAMYYTLGKARDAGLAFTDATVQTIGTFNMIIGFIVMLAIYSDDFRYKTVIQTIGSGISRLKYVVIKLVDTVLLTLLICGIMAIMTLALKIITGTHFTTAESTLVVMSLFFNFITTTACVTMASIFFYLTDNTALGALGYLTFAFVIPLAVYFAQTLAFFSKYHLDRYSIDGLVKIAVTCFITGSVAEGIFITLAVIAIFIGGGAAIGYAVFRNRELDF